MLSRLLGFSPPVQASKLQIRQAASHRERGRLWLDLTDQSGRDDPAADACLAAVALPAMQSAAAHESAAGGDPEAFFGSSLRVQDHLLDASELENCYKVLHALKRVPELKLVEYCPLVTDVVPLFVQHMTPAQSFRAVRHLISHALATEDAEAIITNRHAAHLVFQTLDDLISLHFPRLHQHFADVLCNTSRFTRIWFHRVFVTCLPPLVVLRLVDCVLSEGGKVLVRVALAVLKTLQPQLLAMDSADAIVERLTARELVPEADADRLFKAAFALKLQRQTLRTLLKKNQMVQLSLASGHLEEDDDAALAARLSGMVGGGGGGGEGGASAPPADANDDQDQDQLDRRRHQHVPETHTKTNTNTRVRSRDSSLALVTLADVAAEGGDDTGFCCTGMDWLGFDVDHTLVEFNLPAIGELVFRCALAYMIEAKGYGELDAHTPYDDNLARRGMVIDRRLGNLLQLDARARVVFGFHGSRLLEPRVVRRLYGQRPLEGFPQDTSRFTTLHTAFETPLGPLFAHMVDHVDAGYGAGGNVDGAGIDAEGLGGLHNLPEIPSDDDDEPHEDPTALDYSPVYKDLIAAFVFTYSGAAATGFEPVVMANPKRYVRKQPELRRWLTALRARGVRLFVITNSVFAHTDTLLQFTLGRNWQALFDVVVVNGSKRNFFSPVKQPGFKALNPDTHQPVRGRVQELQTQTVYSGGNAAQLQQLLQQVTDRDRDERGQPARPVRVAYFGDHMLQDVQLPADFGWRTVAVVEELLGVLEHRSGTAEHAAARDDPYHSYCFTTPAGGLTYWAHVVLDSAALCVPSVGWMARARPDAQFDAARIVALHQLPAYCRASNQHFQRFRLRELAMSLRRLPSSLGVLGGASASASSSSSPRASAAAAAGGAGGAEDDDDDIVGLVVDVGNDDDAAVAARREVRQSIAQPNVMAAAIRLAMEAAEREREEEERELQALLDAQEQTPSVSLMASFSGGGSFSAGGSAGSAGSVASVPEGEEEDEEEEEEEAPLPLPAKISVRLQTPLSPVAEASASTAAGSESAQDPTESSEEPAEDPAESSEEPAEEPAESVEELAEEPVVAAESEEPTEEPAEPAEDPADPQ